MSSNDYEAIAAQFPKHIPFPRIDRIHRSGKPTFAEVTAAVDLPSRLLFGDLVPESFMQEAGGWSARYRDAFDNGLDLSVSGTTFQARPRFLGSVSSSAGPADNSQAFQQLVNLAVEQWDKILQTYLEKRFPIRVADHDRNLPHFCYMPDGWLRTILVPIHPGRLDSLLDWHMALAGDPKLGAAQTGSVSLLFNAVNYVEGRCPHGWDDEDALARRSVVQCGTPLVANVEREQGNDGTAAWTVRRAAYLYRCSAFLRDVPYLVERLSVAGFLSVDPDMCAAVVSAEHVMLAEQMNWWSTNRECRITWAGTAQDERQIIADNETTLANSRELVRKAVTTAGLHTRFLGLEANGFSTATGENRNART